MNLLFDKSKTVGGSLCRSFRHVVFPYSLPHYYVVMLRNFVRSQLFRTFLTKKFPTERWKNVFFYLSSNAERNALIRNYKKGMISETFNECLRRSSIPVVDKDLRNKSLDIDGSNQF